MSVVPLPQATDVQLHSNLEAEAALLGALTIENSLIGGISELLRPDDFSEAVHGRIYASIVEEHSAGNRVSTLLLAPRFAKDPDLRELGGVSYLAQLSGIVEGLLAPYELASQIVELADRRRRLEWLAAETRAWGDTVNPISSLGEAPEIRSRAAHLPSLDLATLATTKAEPKHFIIPRIMPSGEVTLFTGPGAVGKSLLAQQFATAIASGRPTLGLRFERSPAIYLTCEDDEDQLHWRQEHICAAIGVGMADLAETLHLITLRGRPDTAIAYVDQSGILVTAPLFSSLRALLRRTSAAILFLDNVAHLFPGNENDRSQVTQFINLLNRLAGETGAAIGLMGHPNKAGASYSGSTGWLNAVRSQVFMSRSEDELDPDLRTLTIGKPNYTNVGEALRFRWHEWAFIQDEDLPEEKRAELNETIQASGDNQLFLTCLRERNKQERAVSEKRSATYAPTVFATMPDSKRIGKERLEAAMDRLFRIGKIERAELWKGADRKPVFGLREVAGDGAGNGTADTVRDTRETLL